MKYVVLPKAGTRNTGCIVFLSHNSVCSTVIWESREELWSIIVAY